MNGWMVDGGAAPSRLAGGWVVHRIEGEGGGQPWPSTIRFLLSGNPKSVEIQS